ncbi:MAG: hypothetical protein HW421_3640 [Ignavibacteria bacterium]|nr:hypothetical protein [Ignavibacteria bacterium]
MIDIITLKLIADIEFAEIVQTSFFIENKLRIVLCDNSFIDVNLSEKIPDKFGFHWETKNENLEIFRYDNFPDSNWKYVETYPEHFHNSKQENVKSSPFPKDIIEGFRAFLNFINEKITLT